MQRMNKVLLLLLCFQNSSGTFYYAAHYVGVFSVQHFHAQCRDSVATKVKVAVSA